MPVVNWTATVKEVAVEASNAFGHIHDLWKRGVIHDEAFVGRVIALGKTTQKDVDSHISNPACSVTSEKDKSI